MTDRSDWEGRTGRKWAEEWRRTDRSFAGLTDRLLSAARGGPATRVLDVGCGAGELSLALGREHAGAQVVGLDISEPLVAAARNRAGNLGNVSFEVADAASWSRSGFVADLIVSRHGVMFFNDPVGAFTHLATLSAARGRLFFSCFRDRSENPWATRLVELLPADAVPAPPGTTAPGPFAFADPSRVEGILRAAGWREIAFEPVDFAFVAGAGGDPVTEAVAYFMAIGPAAGAAAELDPRARSAFIARLEAFLESRRDGSIVALPAAAWIVSACAP